MMKQTRLPDEHWSSFLARLPASLDLEKSAREYGALLRRRAISDAESLLRLALTYGPCGLSLRGVAAWAALCGVGVLSNVAVLNRLRGAADWLGYIISVILSDRCAVDTTLGHRIRLVDGTCISRPGSTGTDWRVHVAYDLCGARFSHFELSDKHGAEDLRRGPITPGEIYIADRNYARLKGLLYIVENGGDFIVRIGWRKVKMLHPDGTPFNLFRALAQLNEGYSGDIPVLVVDGSGRVELSDLPVRLIMVRKSALAIQQQHQRLRKNASKSGHKLDQRTLIASEYMLLLTSLPQAEFGLDMVASLYRLRWQVELAFKRMKSLAHLDKLPAKDNELARSWIYAHLIVALLIDDSCQEFLDSPPCAGRRNKPSSVNMAITEADVGRSP